MKRYGHTVHFAWMIALTGCSAITSSFVPAANASEPPPKVAFPFQGWLGGDVGYSITLPSSSTNNYLWIFGDTYAGNNSSETARSDAAGYTPVHNSIGIANCNKSTGDCTMTYAWQNMYSSKPAPNAPKAFFDSGTSSRWYWPLDGFVYKGTLYVFLSQMVSTGGGGLFSFNYQGVTLATITNPSDPPADWSITYQPILSNEDSVVPGPSAIVAQGSGGNPFPSDPDGASYLYLATWAGNLGNSNNSIYLTRLPLADLGAAAQSKGDWQYLDTSGQFVTWPAWNGTGNAFPSAPPQQLFAGNFTELTIRYNNSNGWTAVMPYQTAQLDQADYSLSSTNSIAGPWSTPAFLYTFPEVPSPNPNGVVCYAAKEHPELESSNNNLVFTYACNASNQPYVIENMKLDGVGFYEPVVQSKPTWP